MNWRPAWSPDGRYWFDGIHWHRAERAVTGWVVGGLGAWVAGVFCALLTAEAIGETPQPGQDQWVWAIRLSPMLPLLIAIVAGAVGFVCGARRSRLARVVFTALTSSSLFVLFMVVPKPA